MELQKGRKKLEEEDKQLCRDILEELFTLYEETDPALGERSQEDKCKKAKTALRKIGQLSAILTEWAENQLFGNYYKAYNLKSDTLDLKEKSSCLHENEVIWYQKKIPAHVFNHMGYLSCARAFLAQILELTCYHDGVMSWRLALANSLNDLNDGQTRKILRPISTKQHGDTPKIKQIKYAALMHVQYLMGEGWKKSAAQQEVADNCGVNFEAVRAWEKSMVTKTDGLVKDTFLKAKFVSEFIHTINKEALEHNISPEDDELLDLCCLFLRYWEETDTKTQKIFEDKAGGKEHIFPEDICYAIINFIDTRKNYPLQSLKERLFSAGMRSTD